MLVTTVSRLLAKQGTLQGACANALRLLCESHRLDAASMGQLRTCIVQPARHYAVNPEDYELLSADPSLANIDGYLEDGFIVNGVTIAGSIVACGPLATMWKVNRLSEITPDSLSMLLLLKPKPDLLVLGTGRRIQFVPEHPLRAWLRENEIWLEAVDTANAVATFNILNKEARMVMGAFLPIGAPTD